MLTGEAHWSYRVQIRLRKAGGRASVGRWHPRRTIQLKIPGGRRSRSGGRCGSGTTDYPQNGKPCQEAHPSQFEAHPREPSFSMGVRDTNLEQDHFPQLWISLLPLQLVSGKPANFRSAPARLPTVAPCLAPTTRPQRRSQIASGR